MKLYFTPKSHFSRKVRILLDAWRLEVELVDVGNVADADPAAFAANPLMRVPTLVDGDTWLVDSDHIARYLARRHDPTDRFDVLAEDVDTLNLRAVANGIMSNEVELILAARTGLDIRAHARFDKLRSAMVRGLEWLDAEVDLLPNRPCYSAFHLVSMWEHLSLYEIVPLPYSRLRACVTQFGSLPYVSASSPIGSDRARIRRVSASGMG